MESFPEINWSEVARGAIKTKIQLLQKFKEFTNESKLTGQDAINLGKKVNESLHKRYVKSKKN
ncbi:hypothetical protein HN587_07210 [Candidatus Woesearchaeota archaeon]|nr:hypothetical protein [Candidatus Woesearchaeota archaeon]